MLRRQVVSSTVRTIVLGLAISGVSCAPTQEDLAQTPDTPAWPRIVAAGQQVTPGFESNRGQTNEKVEYLARGRGHALFLTANEAVMALRIPAPTAERSQADKETGRRPAPKAEPGARTEPIRMAVLRMEFAGANPKPEIVGEKALPGKVSYYIGKDRETWLQGITACGGVRYRQLYPGIDLIFSRGQRHPEYAFHLAPGADPERIRLSSTGAKEIKIADDGDLVLETAAGELRHGAPKMYQMQAGRQEQVAGGFAVDGEQVGFRIAAHDPSKPLVIDPTIEFTGVIGGTDQDSPGAMAIGPGETVYIAGEIFSPDFPGANLTQYVAGTDAIVFKLDLSAPDPMTPRYVRILGSNGSDSASGVAVDDTGSAYVVGTTGFALPDVPPPAGTPIDFPNPNANQLTWGGGGSDGFLAKLDANGDLEFSTLLGGEAEEWVFGLALVTDPGPWSGIYIVGETYSTQFQSDVTPTGAAQGGDGYIAKLNLDASTFSYFTYLGGSEWDRVWDIAVRNGEAYVVGVTRSEDFQPVNPVQPCFGNVVGGGGACAQATNNTSDFIVAKLDTAGAISFSTFLGGIGYEGGFPAIAVDDAGDAYVTGQIWDQDPGHFPVTVGAYQTVPRMSPSGYISSTIVTKLAIPETGAGSPSVAYSTYLGDSRWMETRDIAVNTQGQAYVVGWGDDANEFAVQPPFPDSYAAASPVSGAFVAKLAPDGKSLVYWGLLERGLARHVSLRGSAIYISGHTPAPDFYLPPWKADDIFVVKLVEDQPVVVADLAVMEKTDLPPDPITLGNDFVYSLTVKNLGPDAATDITVTDILPTGFEYDGFDSVPATGDASASCTDPTAPSTEVICTIAALALNESTMIRLYVSPTTTGDFTNTVEVTTTAADDPVDTNNAEAETTVVQAPSPPEPTDERIAFTSRAPSGNMALHIRSYRDGYVNWVFTQEPGLSRIRYDRSGGYLGLIWRNAATVKIVDTASGAEVREFQISGYKPYDMDFDPQNPDRYALVCETSNPDQYAILIYEDGSGPWVYELPPFGSSLRVSKPRLTWSPDGSKLSVAYANPVGPVGSHIYGGTEWSVVDNTLVQPVAVFQSRQGPLNNESISEVVYQGDYWRVIASDKTVTRMVRIPGEDIIFPIGNWLKSSIDLTPDGVATAFLGRVQLSGIDYGTVFRAAPLDQMAPPNVHQGPVMQNAVSVAISSDGMYVAVAVDDGTSALDAVHILKFEESNFISVVTFPAHAPRNLSYQPAAP